MLRLPRELRDMVYAYVVPNTKVSVYETTSIKFRPWHTLPKGSEAIEYSLPYQPDEVALGEVTAKELSEYFHRYTQFRFNGARHSNIIGKCFKSHAFTYPIKKISVVIILLLRLYTDPVFDPKRAEAETGCMRALDDLAKFPANGVDLKLFLSTDHKDMDQAEGFKLLCNIMLPR